MNLRRLSTFTAIVSVVVAAGSFTTAGAAATDLGEYTVGDTVSFAFDCANDANDFFLFINPDTPDQTKVDEQSIDSSADLLLGYQYNTSELEPGVYGAGIECNDDEGIYDFTFTVVAVDPCAPVDTVEVPKGPARAPHAPVTVVCEDSGADIPTTGSTGTSYILMLGTLAVVAGGGLLIVRRRIHV